MTTKNAHEPVQKPKSFVAKVGETKIWQKLFVSRIDYEKAEELKREMRTKYGMMRFWG